MCFFLPLFLSHCLAVLRQPHSPFLFIAKMATSLEQWPPELLESMVEYLPLDDMRNLRLCNKALANLVAQESFTSKYSKKQVDASREGLAAFVEMTKPGVLGGCVQDLTLTGIAVGTQHLATITKDKFRWITEGNGPMFSSTSQELNDDELLEAQQDLQRLKELKTNLYEFHDSGEDVEMLTQVFEALAAYGRYGTLRSLTLEVVVLSESATLRQQPIESGNCKIDVWRAGEAIFRLTVEALSRSGLQLDRLNVMTDQQHCSLSWSALDCITQCSSDRLSRSLASLGSLQLSLAESRDDGSEVSETGAPVQDQSTQSPAVIAARTEEEEHDFGCLARVLSECSQLKSLHLHWFNVIGASEKRRTESASSCLLRQIAKTDRCPALHKLTLRGVYADAPTLLSFISSSPIKQLRLEEVS